MKSLRDKLRKILKEEYNHKEFLKWKRKNITIRGIKDRYEENGSGAMLGRGLYTAFLSNKQLAKEYGKVYYVLNGIPSKPLILDSLNEWEIWLQHNLFKFDDEKYPNKRRFHQEGKTIEEEIQKLGYNGVIIKGREIVNYQPDENQIKYFENDRQLIDYYDFFILGNH